MIAVTGRVRQFNREVLGGELDLDVGVFTGWENRAVIVAESVVEA